MASSFAHLYYLLKVQLFSASLDIDKREHIIELKHIR